MQSKVEPELATPYGKRVLKSWTYLVVPVFGKDGLMYYGAYPWMSQLWSIVGWLLYLPELEREQEREMTSYHEMKDSNVLV